MLNDYRPIPALLDLIKTKSNQDLVRRLKEKGITDLKPHDTAIISLTNHHGGRVEMRLLSERIAMNQPTFVERINKLVRQGYLIKEKSSLDKRAIYIVTTHKSKAIQSMVDQGVEEHLELMLKGLTEEEKALLIKLLHKSAANYMPPGHKPPQGPPGQGPGHHPK